MSLSFLPRPMLRRGARPVAAGEPLAPVSLSDGDRRLAHMAASLLLAYPDEHAVRATHEVRAAVGHLPPPVAERLTGLATALTDGDIAALQAAYVATFDLKLRCTLYLSYYAAGDTRRRGAALLRFAEAYRAVGWEVTRGELPDHLGSVLELSARADGDGARIVGALLAAHRDGIEVLRQALAAEGSPWVAAVEAVCLTLPPVDTRTLERVAALVAEGPPAELVGLTGLPGFGADGADAAGGGPPWT
ncbi:nitrate reductase molybdenum cofactor assembly chaperone [Promicromonospora sukumoe]|uniref:nitrate reductase molybdenum cofactor assembly chaperone n=1 Tax=Promicromonospora sukumoe TaxID=88382 RepID=UPI0003605BDB|nr:nitrate reductase molybdenum cofactor assembly chaperone [Promicromonospora sukumoe]